MTQAFSVNVWSKTPPTDQDHNTWWWWRWRKDSKPEIRHVIRGTHTANPGDMLAVVNHRSTPVALMGGEWAGPIETPVEPLR